ncbi:separase-like [Silene latifolia]|uniref:separase-like n=1 Tax=Silene latifolia TaxID=37657 RepID=UPI003D7785A5
MDVPSQASPLLSKLESYDYAQIDTLFSSFLHPFLNPNKKPPNSKKPSSSSSSIRSLVKIYLPFINKSLSIIPKRLFESPKNPKTAEFLTQLLSAYKICLDCLAIASSELSGKPYSVHLQSARFVHCLLRWERYDEGFDEGLRVLNGLGKVELEGFPFRVSISSGELVPKVVECVDCDGDSEGECDGDEFVRLVVDLVVVVAQCVSIGRCMDVGKYSGLLDLSREVRPWFRHMEASAASKLQWKLLAHMKNATSFLIREVKHFGENLISRFCEATFQEYTQLLNARHLQGRMREELEEFVLFLHSCACKCRSACRKVQCTVAMHLHKSASKFSQGLVYISLVQRVYAIGLNLSQFGAAKGTISASCELLPEGWDKLEDLSYMLESGKCYYNSNSEADLSFYLSALKFLCAPLAQFINSERKRIVKADIEPSLGKALKLIQVAFVEYCYLFPLYQEKEGCREEIDMVVLSISMASFTLSLRLFRNTKGCKMLVNHILSDKFVLQPQMLNYLVCMLHNLFVEFYRYENYKEALKAGKFCCRVSWSRCILLCERAAGKPKGSDEERSDSMIADYVNEACKDNSLLMDILHQIDSSKVDNVILSGLEKWCHSRNLFERLLCPEALMKRWVKIQCKLYANTNANAPILGSHLLVSSYIKNQNISPEIIGIILEQELLLYQELSCFYPGFCQRMQIAIIDILLEKVYLLNNCLQRSIILAKKGFLLRNIEIGGLKSCVDCLSEAINSIDGLPGMIQDKAMLVSNQLAILYCLRALSTQEANPSSKEIFTDISKAVMIWLRSDDPCHFPNSKEDGGYAYILQLMYHIADLLSIKGDTTLHSDMFNAILKVLKQMNVPLDKCLSLLWESRRVNHSLCVLPVSEAFIVALSCIYGKEAESFEFWLNCLQDSRTLSVVFKQNFSFLSSFSPLAFHQHKSSLQSGISVDEVKQVASDLVSMVSESSSSAFLAGHTCYDLSERLSASGKMIEALLYAKEAHRIRSKMLQEYFSFKYELHEASHDEATQKSSNCIRQFTVLSQVAIRAWPNHSKSLEKYDGILLTPWNVLHCFLESSLQVGILHETHGNVAEAEALFLVGKSISCLQNLPRFIVAFSSCLGKVYRGKCLLDLAHKELRAAQQVFDAETFPGTCSRCSFVLESKLNEELGNLCRKGVFSAAVNPYESSLRSLISLEKGDLSVWFEERDSGNPVLGSKDLKGAELDNSNDRPTLAVKNQRTKIRAEAKKSSKPMKELESQATVKPCVSVRHSRVTRSRKQSSQRNEAENEEGIHSVSNQYSSHQTENEVASVSNRVICEKCLLGKLKGLGSLASLIQMKWEYVRRRQILKLLIGLGKCQVTSSATTSMHRIYMKCISILRGGNDCHCLSSTSFELEFKGKEIPADSLAYECAEVFYTFGWYISKALYSLDTRNVHHAASLDKMSHVVSLLKHAYVLSHEIPLLFQKVSKLLALLYLVSASRENPSFPRFSGNVHPENYWAAYFHQAAVGTHYNLQLLSAITEKYNSSMFSEVQGSPDGVGMTEEMHTLLSIVPESITEIESVMTSFFESLPDSAVVCVSFLGKSYVSLLDGLMHYSSSVHGLILLSRFSADNQPVVIVMPVSSRLEDCETSFSGSINGEIDACKEWRSPWGTNALVDDLAPLFKSILRENYLSSSSFPEEDTEKTRQMWWSQRYSLDGCLQKLVREMEESWFHQWKYLLLGRLLDAESLIPAMKKLMQEIKERFKLGVNESVLEMVMSGTKSTDLEKERIPMVFLEKGCYICSVKDCGEGRCSGLDDVCAEADYILGSVFAAVNRHEVEYCTRRDPVVLVLDTNVQMLPWENMPIMREQEVYRVPSVASIIVALQRRSALEKDGRLSARFPLIDPLDSFYFLNPSGDLSRTQAEFQDWFRSQNIQGISGVVPSMADWSAALQNHDLFLYFGHGSGAQYMPPEKVKKLESCAATLLMGCSSGALSFNGCYPPVGTPLAYLLAGAPIVIANLWEVTDRDIDRFAKAMLKCFMEERSMSSTDCIQCSLMAEEFESMTVNENLGNPKRGRRKKKPTKNAPEVAGGYCFKHKLRAGYFVSKARKACKLPYLIGAAPVCYGVPTGIRKKPETIRGNA